MTGDQEITSSEDVIDSRDVIARIGFLERWDCGEVNKPCDDTDCPTHDEDRAAELAALRDLAGQDISEWEDGATLIRDSYFTEYAEQLAEDMGAIDRECSWPVSHIDWEAAAGELLQDYTYVQFNGVTYQVRA